MTAKLDIRWPAGKSGKELKAWWLANVAESRREVYGKYYLVPLDKPGDKLDPAALDGLFLKHLGKKPGDTLTDEERCRCSCAFAKVARDGYDEDNAAAGRRGQLLTSELADKYRQALRGRGVIK